MSSLNTLLTLYLALLAVATVTHSWKLNDDTWPKHFKKSSANSITRAGDSLAPNQLIFVECHTSVNCTIYTRNHKKCNVIVTNEDNVGVTVLYAYQLSDNRVIVKSDEKYTYLPHRTSHILMTFVDVEKCAVTNNLRFNETDVSYVIYENGFDVLRKPNSIKTFKVDGSPSEEMPKNFNITESSFHLFPVSVRWRSKGFFMRTNNETHHLISIIADDGTLFKKLIDIPLASLLVEYASEQLYTVCWDDTVDDKKTVHCAQFDELANEKTRNKIDKDEIKTYFDVRNLRNGGYVLFAHSMNATKIHATAMYLDKEPEESTYDIDEANDEEIAVKNFYQKDGSFILVYLREDREIGDTTFQKFQLPGMLGKKNGKDVKS